MNVILNNTNIEWIEGFDDINNSQLNRLYPCQNNNSVPSGTGTQIIGPASIDTNLSINSSKGRNGGSSLTAITGARSLLVILSGDYSTVTIGFAVRVDGFQSFFGNDCPLAVYSNSQVQTMFQFNLDGTISVYRNGTTTPLGTTTKSFQTGIYYYIEFSVTTHNTTGAYELKVNGESLLSGSGINTRSSNSSNNNVNQVCFGNLATGGFYTIDIDDVYIRNDGTFLGDSRVETQFATSNGTTNNFTPSTGSNWQNVDENPATDDTDYNASSATNDIDLYNYTNLSTTTGTVRAVMIHTVLNFDTDGVGTACTEMRQNSNNYVGGTQNVNANGYSGYAQIEGQDPDTTTTWTISGVNSCQFGVKRLT